MSNVDVTAGAHCLSAIKGRRLVFFQVHDTRARLHPPGCLRKAMTFPQVCGRLWWKSEVSAWLLWVTCRWSSQKHCDRSVGATSVSSSSGGILSQSLAWSVFTFIAHGETMIMIVERVWETDYSEKDKVCHGWPFFCPDSNKGANHSIRYAAFLPVFAHFCAALYLFLITFSLWGNISNNV